MAAAAALDGHFRRGFGAKARPHQLEAAGRLLELLRWHRGGAARALVQHAPGAGKTETILLLVLCALKEGLVDRAVILNYAVDLEEQLLARARRFWGNVGAGFPVRRAEYSFDLPELLRGPGAVLSLLQKFTTCPAQLPEAEASRTLVIVDEAHRGIPEEGTYIQNIDLAFGRASKVLFTATPRPDTLRRFGTLRCDAASEGDVLFRAPFHTYTQRDSIRTGATLNPLEKYVSVVPQIEVDGARLSDTATVPLTEFLERLNAQRTSPTLRTAWAEHVLQQLPTIDKDMPEMIRQGHQAKKLLVLSDMQDVFDMTMELRGQIQRGNLVNAFGQPLQVACFFSGKVQGARSDREANSWSFECPDDAAVLDEADLIAVCQKYTTGWDEWRVVAIFIFRRLGSEALLQQLLGRASRARPGSGKRRPWVFDYLNDPDWVFSAAARFYEECRAYAGGEAEGGATPTSELEDLAKQIGRFFPESPRGPFQEAAALRLPASERALLRAAVLRYQEAADGAGPLDATALGRLLRALNLSMKAQLFGGCPALAERSAEAASRSSSTSAVGARAAAKLPASAGEVPCALKVLCNTLGLRMKGKAKAKALLLETPAKKPRLSERPLLSRASAQALPDESDVSEALQMSIDKLAEAFQSSLARNALPIETLEDSRSRYTTDLNFAAARLVQVGAQQQQAVQVAAHHLRRKLDSIYSGFLQPWLEEEAQRLEWEFQHSAQNHGDDFELALAEAKAAYAGKADKLGGHMGSELKADFAKRLARIVAARLHADRRHLLRQLTIEWASFEERVACICKGSGNQPVDEELWRLAVDTAIPKFGELSKVYGGKQATGFAKSFEEGLRRRAAELRRGGEPRPSTAATHVTACSAPSRLWGPCMLVDSLPEGFSPL